MYKKAEKEKIGENMKGGGDEEYDMLLKEFPYGTSVNHPLPQHHHPQHHHPHMFMNAASPSVCSLSSMQSPSSSFSGGFYSPDEISPSQTPFEEYSHQPPNAHYCNKLWVDSKSPDSVFPKNQHHHHPNEYLSYEQGLCENLYRMNVKDEQQLKDSSARKQLQRDTDGFGLGNRSFFPSIGEKYDPSQAIYNGGLDFGGFRSRRIPMGFDEDRQSSAALLGLRRGCSKTGIPMGSVGFTHNQLQSNALYSDPSCYQYQQINQINHLLEQQRKEQGNSNYYLNRGIQAYNASLTSRPNLNDGLLYSQQFGMDSNIGRSALHPLNSSMLLQAKPYNNGSMLAEKTRSIPNSEVPQPQSFLSMKGTSNLEGFSCEDSFIIQEKSMNYINKEFDRLRGQKKNSCNGIATQSPRRKNLELDSRAQPGVLCENGSSPLSYCALPLQPNYSSLAEIQGKIYHIAKDQHGCRFLQRMFEEGTRKDVQIIFNEIIDHVVELMTNPFGNYLVQKLFDVCNDEQRTLIVRTVTQEPGELVKISLNSHGTRSVQKLIETLKTKQQISSIVSALEPGFLYLIKDLNGNHVVQRCLQCFNNEHNKLIFDAATKFCADIATHRHGCCVLQRCIAHSTGENRDRLVAEICANALLLSQDPFGNYVVQYIIELNKPAANVILNSQFEGNYVYLSMQKFSSHVVEKCLRFIEEFRSKIINELLSASHFEQLLQDPFANYVIQSALEVTKGPVHAMLVEAVRPHTILRTSPYCKRIFSRNLLKK